MTVPDTATLRTIVSEMNAYGFLSGTQGQDDIAWAIAWDMAEDALGTNILTGTVSAERQMWPAGWIEYNVPFRMVQLNKTHLISVDTATIVHDLGNCSCGTDDVTGCVIPYSLERSEVEIRSTEEAICQGCSCVRCSLPAYVDWTYTAGIWNALEDLPYDVKVALAILAKEQRSLAESDGAEMADGFVDQWRSMDYSERRGLLRRSKLGTSASANQAERLLKKYRIRRMVGMRSRPYGAI